MPDERPPMKRKASEYEPRTRLKKYIGKRVSCRSVIQFVDLKTRWVRLGTLFIVGEGEVCDHLWVSMDREPEMAVFGATDIRRLVSFTARPTSYRKSNFEIQYGLKDFLQVQIRKNGAWVPAPVKEDKP